MNRIRDILIFSLCILLALAPAVSANSGPSWWEGTTATGTIVTGEECPIVVDHEKLHFTVEEFPAEYYVDESAFADYKAHVTAEYTFRNPTDADVTVRLLFPFGVVPQYAPAGQLLPWKYAVTADGEPVEATLRHSLQWGSTFVMEEDSARLYDDFMEHSFYSPDTPVTKYIYRPEGVDWETHDSIRALLRLNCDPTRTKIILEPANSFSQEEDHALAGSALREGDEALLYIIGEVPDGSLTWTLSKSSEPIDGTMELVSSGTMTLREYVRSTYTEKTDASEVDLYNAYVQILDRVEAAYGYLSVGFHMELMCWYEYGLTIPAGGTVVNTVTAPLYPDIHMGWDPDIYTYEYLLSPAKGWADFGSLDITVKTPFYMTQCNLEGFEKTDGGYVLHLEGLPDKELEFVLCQEKNPARPGSRGDRMLLIVGAAAAALFGGLAVRMGKRRKNNG